MDDRITRFAQSSNFANYLVDVCSDDIREGSMLTLAQHIDRTIDAEGITLDSEFYGGLTWGDVRSAWVASADQAMDRAEVEEIMDQENEEPFYWLTRYRLENPNAALPIGWYNLPDRYLEPLARRLGWQG